MGRRSETPSGAEDSDEEVDVPTTTRTVRAASKKKSSKKVEEENDGEEVITPSRKRKPPKDDDAEENEDPSEADAEGSDDEEAAAKPSSSRKKRKSSKKSQLKDNDEESENEENEKPVPKKSGRKKKETVKEEELEYEVEKIVDDRAIKGRIQYKIRWKGYLSEDDTWENESTLDCTELIEEYNDAKGDDSKANGSSETPAAKTSKSRGHAAKTDTNKGKEKQQKSASSNSKTGKDKRYKQTAPDKNGEWEVLRIIDMHTLKNGGREFLVRWKGYPPEDDSWEPEAHLKGTDLLEKFLKKVEQNATVATPSRSGGRRTTVMNYNYDGEEEEESKEEEDVTPRKRVRQSKTPNRPHSSNAQPQLGGVTLPEIEKCVSAVIDKKRLAKQEKLDEILKSVSQQSKKLNDLNKSIDELRKEYETLHRTLEDFQSKMAP